MNKYLVVISYCEEETHLFDTKEDMFKYFEVSSFKELLQKSNYLSCYTIYEVCKIWSDD